MTPFTTRFTVPAAFGRSGESPSEIERRMAEIRKNPILSRRLDELRRGVTERATVAQRIERMRGDRIEELVRSRRMAAV